MRRFRVAFRYMHEADYFDLEFLEILVQLGYADDPPPSRPSPMPYFVPFRSPIARTVAQPAEVHSFESERTDAFPRSSEMLSRSSVNLQNEVSRSVRTGNGVTGAFLLASKIHSRNPLGDITCFLTSSILADLRKNPFSKTPVTLVPDTAPCRSQTVRTRGSPGSMRIHHLISGRFTRRHRHTWDANVRTESGSDRVQPTKSYTPVRTASGSDRVQLATSYTLGRKHVSTTCGSGWGFKADGQAR